MLSPGNMCVRVCRIHSMGKKGHSWETTNRIRDTSITSLSLPPHTQCSQFPSPWLPLVSTVTIDVSWVPGSQCVKAPEAGNRKEPGSYSQACSSEFCSVISIRWLFPHSTFTVSALRQKEGAAPLLLEYSVTQFNHCSRFSGRNSFTSQIWIFWLLFRNHFILTGISRTFTPRLEEG